MTKLQDKAREVVDRRLQQASWRIQDMAPFDPAAGCGVAVREVLTHAGPVEDVLPGGVRKPVGVFEPLRDGVGQRSTGHETQTGRYASPTLK
jgi:type I restriction enzyme R subunit